jgi:hypothetical protein
MKKHQNQKTETLFPKDSYTPFGYIDNPYHSAVHNKSGVFRTVPPVGQGFWCRNLPFPYGNGFGLLRNINYLSFVHPSFSIGDIVLHDAGDYEKNNIELHSYYHTKNMMSYDFNVNGIAVSLKYFLQQEDVLSCIVSLENPTGASCDATMHLTNIYGFPETRWWGCDGFSGSYNKPYKAAVSKIWAYGDVFALGADRAIAFMKATGDPVQWASWIYSGDRSSNHGAFTQSAEPIYATLSYDVSIGPGECEELTFSLVRDVNESFAVDKLYVALPKAEEALQQKYREDNAFYSRAPQLTGDFSNEWKHGMIYHFETIRMTMRPPVGRYRHHWDSMQVHTPRSVLGETAIDCMCLSYGDPELAKEVIYGTFADAIAPNVPCSREDGSVNMISQDGSECATAPIWVLLFPTIRFIHARTGDDIWISKLYDYLERYMKWWEDNRTDKEGYFHVKCSWEAQDGSQRFALDYENGEADVAADVTGTRTVDLQAAMADGYRCMVYFSKILGKTRDTDKWEALSRKHGDMTNKMFHDGEFRDFHVSTGKPIIQKDYHDVMMTAPFAVNVANASSREQGKWIFSYFKENPKHWLEWPSYLYIFTEAAWNCDERRFISDVVSETADREFPKLDARTPRDVMVKESGLSLPSQYNYRLRGVANEFWAIDDDNPGGCENYGWGATLPTLIIRNILGFHEIIDARDERFLIAPTIPGPLVRKGGRYGIRNLQYRNHTVSYSCMVDGDSLDIELEMHLNTRAKLTILDNETGKVLAVSDAKKYHHLDLRGENGKIYEVHINPDSGT